MGNRGFPIVRIDYYTSGKHHSNKPTEVKVTDIDSVKKTQDETKFKALEEEAADAMEVAAQKDAKREKAKAG